MKTFHKAPRSEVGTENLGGGLPRVGEYVNAWVNLPWVGLTRAAGRAPSGARELQKA